MSTEKKYIVDTEKVEEERKAKAEAIREHNREYIERLQEQQRKAYVNNLFSRLGERVNRENERKLQEDIQTARKEAEERIKAAEREANGNRGYNETEKDKALQNLVSSLFGRG